MSAFKALKPIYETGKFVVLDTETTGIAYGSEIIEIAVIDQDGKPLVNTRVKPKNTIPADASAIHGIKGRDVEGAPEWTTVRALVREALTGQNIIIYNCEYDTKMLRSTDGVHKLKDHQWDMGRFFCAMLAYAEFAGDWNDYRESWRWHKLTSAMYQQNLPVGDAHSALGDTKMTLALLHKMYKTT